jgi:hypothetical protein
MLGYIIAGCSFFILYTLLRLLIAKILIGMGKTNVSISTVNFVSAFISISILGYGVFMWINSTLENDDIEISNFKIEKSVIERKPDFSDSKPWENSKSTKTTEKFYVYFSLDFVNKGDKIRNFSLFNELILNDFNKMGDSKTIQTVVTLYDNSKKRKEFNDIQLFNENETLKGYGYFVLDDEKIKWINDNISFEPEIIFKAGGRNSSDESISGTIQHEIDLSKLKEFMSSSYKDPNTIKVEYSQKDQYAPSKLTNNIWSEKRKKAGKKDTNEMGPDEILEYLFIK